MREWRFSTICSCDLDVDPMIFIYELELYATVEPNEARIRPAQFQATASAFNRLSQYARSLITGPTVTQNAPFLL